MLRIAIGVSILVVALTVACSPQPRVAPKGEASKAGTMTQDGSYMVSSGAQERSPTLVVRLGLKRSRPTASGESTLGIFVIIDPSQAGTRTLVAVEPGYSVVARSSQPNVPPVSLDTSVAPWGEFARRPGVSVVPLQMSSVQLNNWLATLPPGTNEVVLTAFIGETEAQARRGFSLTVPVADVPLVDRVALIAAPLF